MNAEKSIKKNFLYSAAYQLLLIVLPFITAPYISRTLGSYQIGVYSYSNAYANYFLMFSLLGVVNYGNRTLAGIRDDREIARKTFWEIYAFQLLMSLLMIIAYVIFSVFIIKEDNMVFYVQAFFVISAALDVNWACFALENFKLTAIRSCVVRIIMAIMVFVFIKDTNDLVLYVLILSLGSFISNLIIWPFIIKQFPFIKPTLVGIRKHIKPNAILFIPIIAISIYNVMDKLMLEYFSTKDEVGFYALAERIVLIPNTILLALDNVVMPKMSNLFKKKRDEEALTLMHHIMNIVMFFSCAFTFGLASIAPEFTVWFYGNEYVRCGLFVLLLSPIILFKGFAGGLRTQYLIPKSKDLWYISSLISGAVVNLIFNLILIPKYMGVGAIIGTVLAEMTVASVQFALCSKELPIGSYLKNGLWYILIGIVMFLLLSIVPVLSTIAVIDVLIRIMIGGIIFMGLGYLYLKVSKNEDLIKGATAILRR